MFFRHHLESLMNDLENINDVNSLQERFNIFEEGYRLKNEKYWNTDDQINVNIDDQIKLNKDLESQYYKYLLRYPYRFSYNYYYNSLNKTGAVDHFYEKTKDVTLLNFLDDDYQIIDAVQKHQISKSEICDLLKDSKKVHSLRRYQSLYSLLKCLEHSPELFKERKQQPKQVELDFF